MEINILKRQIQSWIIESLFISNCYSNERHTFISPDFSGITVCLELVYVLDVPEMELPVYLNSKDDALRISVVGHPKYVYIKDVDVEDKFSYLTDIILQDISKIDINNLKN